MTEENTVVPEKKVVAGFMQRNFEDKLAAEEAELEELKKKHAGVSEEDDEEAEEPKGKEEATFKKRYGDLRRHSQKQKEELEQRIARLEQQLEASSRKEMQLPKSEEEIEEWASKYPDVAKIIETIAIKKAKEQASQYEDKFKQIDEMRYNAAREKAEAELLRMHPDLPEIQEDERFHDWLSEQPTVFQNAVYDNADDAKAAGAVISAYKAQMGIGTKKRSKSSDAAKDVQVRSSRSTPDASDSGGVIRESEVAKMSSHQYEAMQEKIAEAIRTGKFVYDMSGSAR